MSKLIKNFRYRLQRRTNKKWEEKISLLNEDKYLQIKVASICWWDWSGHDQKRLGTDSLRCLYVIMKQYQRYMEEEISFNKLAEALQLMGYSKLEAIRRAKKPEDRNGADYK